MEITENVVTPRPPQSPPPPPPPSPVPCNSMLEGTGDTFPPYSNQAGRLCSVVIDVSRFQNGKL